jgi:hypothetical protein
MKFPYGISDFRSIVLDNYFYCDRTDKIHNLEQSKYQLFIRPRRFGKSLLLSMLDNYYDVGRKDEFESIFGQLAIGKNPTSRRNSYFILKFDFSCVDPSGSADDIKKSFYTYINGCIAHFLSRYDGFALPEVDVSDDALGSIESLVSAVAKADYPIYLLIDEYDNFANEVMMRVRTEKDRYTALVHEEGPLKTLFKVLKSATSSSVIDRMFITGVSPVVMSDITSGYNIAENIYLEAEFNDLCGFHFEELETVVTQIASDCDLGQGEIADALELLKTYYNGYSFSFALPETPQVASKTPTQVYNPTLCLYFLKKFQKTCGFPRNMLDSNLAVDSAKLEFVANLPKGQKLLLDLVERNREVVISEMSDRFGISEMLSDESRDNAFLASFLYYSGVLTLSGETDDLEVILRVPNLVMQKLYIERIQRMLLPEPDDRDNGKLAAKQVYKGDIAPLCDFIENCYFRVFDNRDYITANELTVKTAFLTLLYNDIIYIMDSEQELERRYADLTMIIRPDKRYGAVFDVLIEFKFVSLKDAGLSGAEARKLSREDLSNMPVISRQLEEGICQVTDYGLRLEQKYTDLRLKKFVVVSLGFDRLCYTAV